MVFAPSPNRALQEHTLCSCICQSLLPERRRVPRSLFRSCFLPDRRGHQALQHHRQLCPGGVGLGGELPLAAGDQTSPHGVLHAIHGPFGYGIAVRIGTQLSLCGIKPLALGILVEKNRQLLPGNQVPRLESPLPIAGGHSGFGRPGHRLSIPGIGRNVAETLAALRGG